MICRPSAWLVLLLAAWAAPRAWAGAPVSADLLEFLGTVGGGPPGWSAYLAHARVDRGVTAAAIQAGASAQQPTGDPHHPATAPGGPSRAAQGNTAPGPTSPASEAAQHS